MLLSTPSFYGIVSIFPEGHLLQPPPSPIYIFPEHPPPPLQLSTKEYLNWMIFDIFMLADLFPSGLAAKT